MHGRHSRPRPPHPVSPVVVETVAERNSSEGDSRAGACMAGVWGACIGEGVMPTAEEPDARDRRVVAPLSRALLVVERDLALGALRAPSPPQSGARLLRTPFSKKKVSLPTANGKRTLAGKGELAQTQLNADNREKNWATGHFCASHAPKHIRPDHFMRILSRKLGLRTKFHLWQLSKILVLL